MVVTVRENKRRTNAFLLEQTVKRLSTTDLISLIFCVNSKYYKYSIAIVSSTFWSLFWPKNLGSATILNVHVEELQVDMLHIKHFTLYPYHKLVSDEDSSQNFEEFQCWTAEKVNVLLKTADIGAHLFAVTWRTYCSRGRNPPRFNQLLTLDCCCCSRKRILPPSLTL